MDRIKEVGLLIEQLESGPDCLRDLLGDIPNEMLKKQRRKGKWSMHEHFCHIVQADDMILDRFERFQNEEYPVFEPYLPDIGTNKVNLLELHIEAEMNRFFILRKKMIKLLKGFDPLTWQKSASHPEYIRYNPYILLRHTLMHQYFHMYRIEELWLTHDDFL